MNEETRKRLIADMLREAMAEAKGESSKQKTDNSLAPCGCEDNCGEASKHTEDTVLVGVVVAHS